jgi:2'-5' RNA ligase
MPYALTLGFDDDASLPVKAISAALADHAADDDPVLLGVEPHITLAVLPDETSATTLEEIAFGLAREWEALPVTLGAIGIFPGDPTVIWLAPVATEQLLARHAELHKALSPLHVHPHYAPGSWIPHVTLSQQRRTTAAQAIEIVSSAWQGPITGRAERLELVRFHPATVLRSHLLLTAA